MNWTSEQQLAIDQRESNILVAAAAGSGKTAVLVERIKKLIIEDGVPIDKMLIVTFTNAAASEMKEKIRKAINESIDADPEHSKVLREQLALLPKASISTFHAFALNVIRNFFFLCDIELGFSICDEAEGTVIREEALDVLLNSEFAKGEPDFYEFLNWYSGDRNHKKIREIIAASYKALQALPHPWQWLDENIEALGMTKEEFENSEVMEYFWDFVSDALEKAASYSQSAVDLLSAEGLDRLAEMVNSEWEVYDLLRENAKNRNLEETRKAFDKFPSIRLTARADEKDSFNQIKPSVDAYKKEAKKIKDNMRDTFFSQSLDEQVLELNQTKPMAVEFRTLLREFDKLFKLGKAEKNLVDFNDVEHYCLDILEHEDAAKHYRDKFDYIFIDEYQDTSVLQEEIISKVKRDNNLFMVGDIKQSIYKFRLAEPSIFKEKYDSYSNPQGEPSVKIDLNKNYRSKSKILHEINDIFKDLMDDYNADAMLYPGLDYDGEYNYTPQLRLVDTGTLSDADPDDEIAALKNAELEALEVGRIINENLGKKYFDSKAGVEKTIRPRDIVILMRSIKNQAEQYYHVLKDMQINAYVDDNEGYFDTIEINVFMNLLSVIDNKQQDVPLISALHSEIFGFSADELAKVRTEHKENSFAEAFIWYCENGGDNLLKEKCIHANENINQWKIASRAMALPQFIWYLLMDTKYYIEIGAIPGGNQRQANLRALVDRAEKFSAVGQVSLYSFMKYIDAVKQRKVTMGQVKLVSENEDIVRIMSIHKSKGLEFPMVIVAGIGKGLRYSKNENGIAIHKNIGIGMTLASFEEHWVKKTILQNLIAKQVKREEIQEEVRVLYVALTRAKDFLYMTGTINSEEQYRESRDLGIAGNNSYLNMIKGTSRISIINCNQLSFNVADNPASEFFDATDDNLYAGTLSDEEKQALIERLNYKYPHKTDEMIKSKYSVSDLNHRNQETETLMPVIPLPKFKQGQKRMTAAERGTIYHGFMERLDFDKVAKEGRGYIEASAEEYIASEIFLKEEVDAIDFDKLLGFFKTDIGLRCIEASKKGSLRKETPFTLLDEVNGESVMVQGIIDCYFEEDGQLVLLDYKTNWIDESLPIEDEKKRIADIYRTQMKMYAKALEKATNKKVKEAGLYLFSGSESVPIDLKGEENE